MTLFLSKPYLIFLTASPIAALFGLLSVNGMFEVMVYNSYYGIGHSYIGLWIALMLAVVGTLYWLLSKSGIRLMKWLTLFHVILTFEGFLLIYLTELVYVETTASSAGFTYDRLLELHNIPLVIMFILVIGQIIFPVNILLGILNNNPKTTFGKT